MPSERQEIYLVHSWNIYTELVSSWRVADAQRKGHVASKRFDSSPPSCLSSHCLRDRFPPNARHL